jgi:hypothetical protein
LRGHGTDSAADAQGNVEMKTLNEKDRSLLIKILNLTTSDKDGEAMNAIRAANNLLKRNNMSWEDLPTAAMQSAQIPGGDFAEALRRAGNMAPQRRQGFVWPTSNTTTGWNW